MRRVVNKLSIFLVIMFLVFSVGSQSLGFVYGSQQDYGNEAVASETLPILVPGEVLVKFNEAATMPERLLIERGNNAIQLVKIKKYDVIENLFLYQKENPGEKDFALAGYKEEMEDILAQIRRMPGVEYAQPNFIYTKQSAMKSTAPSAPSVAKWQQLWGLSNTGGLIVGQEEEDERRGLAGFDIDVLRAWTITKGSRDIIVAIADDGVDPHHLEFVGRVIQDNTANPVRGYIGEEDEEGELSGNHGTHVAGTIAASYGSGSIVGVAPEVRILPINILANPSEDAFNASYGTSDIAINSIEYAVKNGAQIMNNSWGEDRWEYLRDEDDYLVDSAGNIIEEDEDGFVDEEDEHRRVQVSFFEDWGYDLILREAIKSVEDTLLYVVAAGNESNNNDQYHNIPGMFGHTRLVQGGTTYPPLKNIITVAAVDNSGRVPDFSNVGVLSVHIAAPGWGIYSSFVNDEYGIYDGTSMAAPHVAGVAALMYSVNPNLTPAEAIEIIIETATDLPDSAERRKIMNGKMVNAFAALQEVIHRMGGDVLDTEAVEEEETEHQMAPSAGNTIKLVIDQSAATVNETSKNLDAAPFIANGRTMVPFRFIGEELGAAIEWQAETRSVSYVKGDLEIVLDIDSTTATVNGVTVVLDAAPVIKNGRTVVPVRFISETLGYSVGWDEASKTVTVSE